MDPILQKFKAVFLDEASGLLDQLEKDLLDLEAAPGTRELIESAFRAMHTLKGASGMYGFDHVSEITHLLESLYQAIRDNHIQFSKQIFDITFQSIDHIRKLLQDEQLSDPGIRSNQKRILTAIQSLLENVLPVNIPDDQKGSEPRHSTWHILLRSNEQIYFRGISMTGLLQDLALLGTFEISRLDILSNAGVDTWSIILYTDSSENDIRDVLMFIEDDCTITRLSSWNLFEDPPLQATSDEPSIQDYVENQEKSGESLLPDTEKNTGNSSSSEKSQRVKRISVDSTKLDHLMYLVSELITLNSQFTLTTSESQYEKIKPYSERLEMLSMQFRNNALDIRLVPLSESVLRFKRLIRDLSRQLDKKVNLITDGTDTEVDKGTIDHLNDPLMHILRNCIDHGIESPQLRRKNGKPETGTIRIAASNSGNYVIIRIEDDGAGIDLEKVHKKAIEKGLVKAGVQPSRQELLDMIFLPGFSTAKNLTEVSGRGVGMDVVKRKVAEMRGEVSVDTQPGQWTSFTLKLQQSVAIIDTLLFTVEGTFFTVPVSDIRLCLQLPFTEIQRRIHTGTLPFENQLIPYLDVRTKFHLGGQYGENVKAIILHNNEHMLALLADTIIGGHQAVLKPLGNLFRNQKWIAAASQLGDGKLAFTLDTTELFLEIGNNDNHQ